MTPEIHRRGGVDESMHSIFIRTSIWTCLHTITPTLQGKVSSLHPWTAPGVSHSPEPGLVSKVQPIPENRCDFNMHIVVVVVVVRISHFPFIFFLPWRLRLLLGREYLFPLRTGNSLRLCYLYYHYHRCIQFNADDHFVYFTNPTYKSMCFAGGATVSAPRLHVQLSVAISGRVLNLFCLKEYV